MRWISVVVLLLLVASLPACGNSGTVTIDSASPDGARRLILVDFVYFDRNFVLKHQKSPGASIVDIFRSPDEGRPPGTERIIWSTDGTRAILVGRHFYVREGQHMAPSGEVLYLWIDAVEGKVLGCNSDQSTRYAPFKLADVKSSTSWPDDAALNSLPPATATGDL